MRLYDVYRCDDLVARVRVLDNRQIEWSYRQESSDWQDFWWSNETKSIIDEIVEQYPGLEVLVVSEFKIRKSGT
jgi:hypothetical protein